MHQDELYIFNTHIFKIFINTLGIHRITFGYRKITKIRALHTLVHIIQHQWIYIKTDIFSIQIFALKQRRAATHKRLKHRFTPFGISAQELIWDLRDKITAIDVFMFTTFIALGDKPKTIGVYVTVFPVTQIQIINLHFFA